MLIGGNRNENEETNIFFFEHENGLISQVDWTEGK
jgi:hypothetical protein